MLLIPNEIRPEGCKEQIIHRNTVWNEKVILGFFEQILYRPKNQSTIHLLQRQLNFSYLSDSSQREVSHAVPGRRRRRRTESGDTRSLLEA